MKDSDALEQVLTLLSHAKIAEKYKDETDEEAIDVAYKLFKKLKERGE